MAHIVPTRALLSGLCHASPLQPTLSLYEAADAFSEEHPHMWHELQRSERVTQRIGQKRVMLVLICLLAIQTAMLTGDAHEHSQQTGNAAPAAAHV